ncbi:hypothetical protein M5D96_005820, partial [Drosophila gunungcola]
NTGHYRDTDTDNNDTDNGNDNDTDQKERSFPFAEHPEDKQTARRSPFNIFLCALWVIVKIVMGALPVNSLVNMRISLCVPPSDLAF